MLVINVGVVGCGDVAIRAYLPGMKELADRVRVVALFDVLKERVNNAAALFPDEAVATYTSYDDFLNHDNREGDRKIDLVFNLTPAPLHRDITARALESGYHAFSEKPIAATVQQANELVEIARQQGKSFFCAPATLVTGKFKTIKQFIGEGRIGTPIFARAEFSGLGPAAWRTYIGDPKVFYTPGVGPMIDMGVYGLTVLTGLFGPAKRAQAVGGILVPHRKNMVDRFYGEEFDVTGPDLYSINLDFGNNTFAHLLASFASPATKGPIFELQGTLGAISISREQWFVGNGSFDLYLRDESPEGTNEGWQNNVAPIDPPRTPGILESGILHAAQVLEDGETQVMTAQHATHVLEIMNAANQSIHDHTSVEIHSTF